MEFWDRRTLSGNAVDSINPSRAGVTRCKKSLNPSLSSSSSSRNGSTSGCDVTEKIERDGWPDEVVNNAKMDGKIRGRCGWISDETACVSSTMSWWERSREIIKR